MGGGSSDWGKVKLRMTMTSVISPWTKYKKKTTNTSGIGYCFDRSIFAFYISISTLQLIFIDSSCILVLSLKGIYGP